MTLVQYLSYLRKNIAPEEVFESPTTSRVELRTDEVLRM